MSNRGNLPNVELVPVASLLPGDSPRLQGVDDEHCRRLAEVDDDAPPILVHRRSMRVIDGMHRLQAARLRGVDTIRVRFFDGDEQEAFVHGVKENIAHGLPLTLADRTAAAHRIIDDFPHLSDRAIAASVGLSDKTVNALRRNHTTHEVQPMRGRMGADGKVRPLDPESGRRRAAEILHQRPEASLREIAAGAGISVGTAHDVRKRIRSGISPLPARDRRPEARPSTQPDAADTNNCPDSKRTTRGTTAPAQIDFSILHTLTKDPALRHSENGRELLRFLHASLARGNWSEHARAVPPHCTNSVSRLARQCAEMWQKFAVDIEGLNP